MTLLMLFVLALAPAIAQSSAPRLVIPEGTVIQLTLREPVSSKLSEPGDQVLAVVKHDVIVDDRMLLPEGTEIIGRVTLAKAAHAPLKGGLLQLTFEQIKWDGDTRRLVAMVDSASDFSRDEKVKSDSEGTLQGGKSGEQVLKNVLLAGGVGGMAASVVILASADRSAYNHYGLSHVGSVAGASIIGGSMVAGVLFSKGKDVRLDSGALVRLKLSRALAVM
jgi:hypothetical protein